MAESTDDVIERWGNACVWCGIEFDGRMPITKEHLLAKVKGGPGWIENLVPACGTCNKDRGTASPVQWLEELRQRGKEPRAEIVESALVAFAERIRSEGGQRKIRPALAAELRKLGHDARF